MTLSRPDDQDFMILLAKLERSFQQQLYNTMLYGDNPPPVSTYAAEPATLTYDKFKQAMDELVKPQYALVHPKMLLLVLRQARENKLRFRRWRKDGKKRRGFIVNYDSLRPMIIMTNEAVEYGWIIGIDPSKFPPMD